MISGSGLIVPGSVMSYDIIERVEACTKKKQACLESFKCLNKELVVALSIELEFL